MPRLRPANALLALVLAALSASATAQKLTPVRFALDWRFEGPAAPYFVAIDKGYYKAEGLEVSIDPGSGSVEGINRVASGAYEMGFADINSLVKYRDNARNLPVKAVMMVYDTPAFSIVTLKKSGITKPRDLEGRILGAPAPDGAYAQWPIFVKANGIDVSVALRALADVDMLVGTKDRRPRTYQHDIGGQEQAGVIVRPVHIEGLDPTDFQTPP